MRTSRQLFFTVFLFLLSSFVLAPCSQAANPSSDAGVEQKRFESQEKTNKALTELQKNAEEPALETEEKETSPASVENLPPDTTKVFVKKINITGNTIISAGELSDLARPFEGKELQFSDIRAVSDNITQVYRSKGYLTSRAYIPPQDLKEGIVEIKILEGKLGAVKVQGNRFFKSENITRFLKNAVDKVMNYNTLKSGIAKMNLHPDREVKAVIIPGQSFGTSDLLLDVDDHQPFHIGGEINNFGTKLTGKERYSVSVRHNNLFGLDDILAVRTQFGREVFAIGGQYALPVGDYQTQIGVSFNYTDVGIGGEFFALKIAGTAYSYSIFVSQPVYSGRYFDLTWTSAYESKSIDNTLLGVSTSHDDLRMFHTGLNIDENDAFGRTFIANDFVWGVPWFAASAKHDPTLSRQDSGASFFKYTATLNRIHPVYDFTYLLLKGSAQATPNKLVSAEQYDIGGVYSVRGYPQSDYLGDYGGGGSAELRVPFYFIPREIKIPGTELPLWNQLHFTAFIDAAHAGLKSPAVGQRSSRNYIGAGGGLRFDLPHNLTGRFEWAAPIGNDPSDGSQSQFYFSISGDLV